MTVRATSQAACTARIAALVVVTAIAVQAQDAVTTLPDNYRVVFENDWVKVTRVHYPAHAKLPTHTHTTWAAAYVYLTDSGPVVFGHIGGSGGAVTRPPTKARAFRLFRAVPDEVHEVHNTGDTPSDFLRIEFKTDPGPDPRSLRGRFFPEHDGRALVDTVQFENAQVAIRRLFAPAGRTLDLPASPQPALLVWLTGHHAGRVRWLPPGTSERLRSNASTGGVEALRFELKTRPR